MTSRKNGPIDLAKKWIPIFIEISLMTNNIGLSKGGLICLMS
jgi:hypothetical protein